MEQHSTRRGPREHLANKPSRSFVIQIQMALASIAFFSQQNCTFGATTATEHISFVFFNGIASQQKNAQDDDYRLSRTDTMPAAICHLRTPILLKEVLYFLPPFSLSYTFLPFPSISALDTLVTVHRRAAPKRAEEPGFLDRDHTSSSAPGRHIFLSLFCCFFGMSTRHANMAIAGKQEKTKPFGSRFRHRDRGPHTYTHACAYLLTLYTGIT